MAWPLASVVPLITDKAGAPLLFVTIEKFTVRPWTATPEPSVTAAVRMLCCPAASEDGLAVNTIFNPADVADVAVLVIITSAAELYPPLLTLAWTVS
jgi:hypothetical protein